MSALTSICVSLDVSGRKDFYFVIHCESFTLWDIVVKKKTNKQTNKSSGVKKLDSLRSFL